MTPIILTIALSILAGVAIAYTVTRVTDWALDRIYTGGRP